MSGAIIFFDGMCNFCSSSVLFIIRHDKYKYFHFVAQQSVSANNSLSKESKVVFQESIVLQENGKYFHFSTAALRIARKLSFPWNLMYACIIIPSFLRDPFYKWFASKRYKWFGKREFCFLPDDKDKSRFDSITS